MAGATTSLGFSCRLRQTSDLQDGCTSEPQTSTRTGPVSLQGTILFSVHFPIRSLLYSPKLALKTGQHCEVLMNKKTQSCFLTKILSYFRTALSRHTWNTLAPDGLETFHFSFAFCSNLEPMDRSLTIRWVRAWSTKQCVHVFGTSLRGTVAREVAISLEVHFALKRGGKSG